MEILDVKNNIKSGEFPDYYIFYGKEHAIIKIYIKMIAEKGGYEISYVDSLIDIMTGAKTKSLVPTHHLYVIMDDKEFSTNEQMWEKFKGLKNDLVIFYYTNADKRLKFWKNFKDRAVEFAPLDVRVLTKYIKEEVPLSDGMCQRLIDICGNDYGRILLEIDKLKSYCRAEGFEENTALEVLIDEGVIYRNPKDAIFAFVDAFLERNPAKAYDLLQQSKAVGEANMVILSVLYNNVKILLQIQSSSDYKALGLTNWQIFNVKKHTDNYTNGELVKILKLIRKCERGIKTGEIPDELSVEYVMVCSM